MNLLQYNPQVFLNEVACLVVFYLLAKIFLHQKQAHIAIHADHHHIFLLKILLFFELLDLTEVFNSTDFLQRMVSTVTLRVSIYFLAKSYPPLN